MILDLTPLAMIGMQAIRSSMHGATRTVADLPTLSDEALEAVWGRGPAYGGDDLDTIDVPRHPGGVGGLDTQIRNIRQAAALDGRPLSSRELVHELHRRTAAELMSQGRMATMQQIEGMNTLQRGVWNAHFNGDEATAAQLYDAYIGLRVNGVNPSQDTLFSAMAVPEFVPARSWNPDVPGQTFPDRVNEFWGRYPGALDLHETWVVVNAGE